MPSKIKKSVCLLLIGSLLVSDLARANPILTAASPQSENRTPAFSIPSSLGTVRKTFLPKFGAPGRAVFHISTTHSDEEGSRRIAEIIRYLQTQEHAEIVLAEGAAEPFDAGLLRFFPDPEKNRKLLDVLVQKGYAGGADLAAASGMSVSGIENPVFYRPAFKEFKKVIQNLDRSREYTAAEKRKIDRRASKIFSPAFKKTVDLWFGYQTGNRAFGALAADLKEEADRTLGIDFENPFSQFDWPQMTRLVLLQALEKRTDEKAFRAEAEELKKKMEANQIPAGFIENLENENEDEMLPRAGFQKFMKASAGAGIRMKDYPQTVYRSASRILRQELDADALFAEMDRLFEKIFKAKASKPEELALLNEYRDLAELEKLLSLELTRGEWEKMSGGTPFAVPAGSPVFETYRSALAFYRMQAKREAAFLETVRMQLRAHSRIILVTGGFHGEGMAGAFEREKIPFAEITPRLGGEPDRSLYHAVMLGRSHLEKPELAAKAGLGDMEFYRAELAAVRAGAGQTGLQDSPFVRDRERFIRRSELRHQFLDAVSELKENGEATIGHGDDAFTFKLIYEPARRRPNPLRHDHYRSGPKFDHGPRFRIMALRGSRPAGFADVKLSEDGKFAVMDHSFSPVFGSAEFKEQAAGRSFPLDDNFFAAIAASDEIRRDYAGTGQTLLGMAMRMAFLYGAVRFHVEQATAHSAGFFERYAHGTHLYDTQKDPGGFKLMDTRYVVDLTRREFPPLFIERRQPPGLEARSEMRMPPGTIFTAMNGTKFETDGFYSEGAFAVVYRAKEIGTGRPAAVKVFKNPQGVTDLQLETAFRFEVSVHRALADMRKKYVPAFLGEGKEPGGKFWYAMDYVSPRNFAAALYFRPVPEAVGRFLALLGFVADMNAAGVLHLDLRGENVLIGPGDEIKITDFGLAQFHGQRSPAEEMLTRNPYWTSHELDRFIPAAPASEIYTLGVLLYSVLTGDTAFYPENGSGPKPLRDLPKNEPEAKYLLKKRLPPEAEKLAPVLVKALKEKPEDRFQSAAEMRRAIEEVMGLAAPDHAKLSFPARWARKMPHLFFYAGIAGGILSFAVSLYFVPLAVYLAYFPVFLEGWGLIGVTLLAHSVRGSFFKQATVLAGGTALLFAAFHILLPAAVPFYAFNAQFTLGSMVLNVVIRFFAVLLGVVAVKSLEKAEGKKFLQRAGGWLRGMANPVLWAGASGWAVANGLVMGAYIYFTFYHFQETAMPSAPFTVLGKPVFSTALYRTAFDLSFSTFLMHAWMSIFLSSIFGRKENPFSNFRQSFKRVLHFYPYNFVIWSIALIVSWSAFTASSIEFKLVNALTQVIASILIFKIMQAEQAERTEPKEKPAARSEMRGMPIGKGIVKLIPENLWKNGGAARFVIMSYRAGGYPELPPETRIISYQIDEDDFLDLSFGTASRPNRYARIRFKEEPGHVLRLGKGEISDFEKDGRLLTGTEKFKIWIRDYLIPYMKEEHFTSVRMAQLFMSRGELEELGFRDEGRYETDPEYGPRRIWSLPVRSEMRAIDPRLFPNTLVLFPTSGFYVPDLEKILWDPENPDYELISGIYHRANKIAAAVLGNPSFDMLKAVSPGGSGRFDLNALAGEENAIAYQVLTAVNQIAAWELFKKRYGIQKFQGRILGASRGTSAAYYAAGVMTLEEAVELAARNAQFLKAASDHLDRRRLVRLKGVDETLLQSLLGERKGAAAVRYTPKHFIVSLPENEIDALEKSLPNGAELKKLSLHLTSHDPALTRKSDEVMRKLAEDYDAFLIWLAGGLKFESSHLYSALFPGALIRTPAELLKEERAALESRIDMPEAVEKAGAELKARQYAVLGAAGNPSLQYLADSQVFTPSTVTAYLSKLKDFEPADDSVKREKAPDAELAERLKEMAGVMALIEDGFQSLEDEDLLTEYDIPLAEYVDEYILGGHDSHLNWLESQESHFLRGTPAENSLRFIREIQDTEIPALAAWIRREQYRVLIDQNNDTGRRLRALNIVLQKIWERLAQWKAPDRQVDFKLDDWEELLFEKWHLPPEQADLLAGISAELLQKRRSRLIRAFRVKNAESAFDFEPLDHPELLALKWGRGQIDALKTMEAGAFEAFLFERLGIEAGKTGGLLRRLDDPVKSRLWTSAAREFRKMRTAELESWKNDRADDAAQKKRTEALDREDAGQRQRDWEEFLKRLSAYALAKAEDRPGKNPGWFKGKKVVVPRSAVSIRNSEDSRRRGSIYLFTLGGDQQAELSRVIYSKPDVYFEFSVEIAEDGTPILIAREAGRSRPFFAGRWNGKTFEDMLSNAGDKEKFRRWFFDETGGKPGRPMKLFTRTETVRKKKYAFLLLFTVAGGTETKKMKRVRIGVNERFFPQKGRRAFWINAEEIGGRKFVTMHLRPGGPALGRYLWDEKSKEFIKGEGPAVSEYMVPGRRRLTEWYFNPWDAVSLGPDVQDPFAKLPPFKASVGSKDKSKGGSVVLAMISPGGEGRFRYLTLRDLAFRNGEDLAVNALQIGDEKRITVSTSEIPGERKAEVFRRFAHADEEILLTPEEELQRRFEAWTPGNNPMPIAVTMRQNGTLLLGKKKGAQKSVGFSAEQAKKDRLVFVTFREQEIAGRKRQVLRIYGRNFEKDPAGRFNELLRELYYDEDKNQLVSTPEMHRRTRLLEGDELRRVQLDAWRLAYSPRPDPEAPRSEMRAESVHLTAEQARELFAHRLMDYLLRLHSRTKNGGGEAAKEMAGFYKSWIQQGKDPDLSVFSGSARQALLEIDLAFIENGREPRGYKLLQEEADPESSGTDNFYFQALARIDAALIEKGQAPKSQALFEKWIERLPKGGARFAARQGGTETDVHVDFRIKRLLDAQAVIAAAYAARGSRDSKAEAFLRERLKDVSEFVEVSARGALAHVDAAAIAAGGNPVVTEDLEKNIRGKSKYHLEDVKALAEIEAAWVKRNKGVATPSYELLRSRWRELKAEYEKENTGKKTGARKTFDFGKQDEMAAVIEALSAVAAAQIEQGTAPDLSFVQTPTEGYSFDDFDKIRNFLTALDKVRAAHGMAPVYVSFKPLDDYLRSGDGFRSHDYYLRLKAEADVFQEADKFRIRQGLEPVYEPQVKAAFEAYVGGYRYASRTDVFNLTLNYFLELDLERIKQGAAPVHLNDFNRHGHDGIADFSLEALLRLNAASIEKSNTMLDWSFVERLGPPHQTDWMLRPLYQAWIAAGNLTADQYSRFDHWVRNIRAGYRTSLAGDYLQAEDFDAFAAELHRTDLQPEAVYDVTAYPVDEDGKSFSVGLKTGEEISGSLLPWYGGSGNALLRSRKVRDRAPLPGERGYDELLKNSLRYYLHYSREIRRRSFLGMEIQKGMKDEAYFKKVFAVLAKIPAEDPRDYHVTDLSRVFHDVVSEGPESEKRLNAMLAGMAAADPDVLPLTRETALKVLRGASIGEVVLTAMESNWKDQRFGGVSVYITDLARALASMGVAVTVVNPWFVVERDPRFNGRRVELWEGPSFTVRYGERGNETEKVSTAHGVSEGVHLVFLKNNHFMVSLHPAHGGSDVWTLSRNHWRFTRMLSYGAIKAAVAYNLYAGVFVMNDWGSGFTGAYLHPKSDSLLPDPDHAAEDSHVRDAKVIYVNHNGHPDHTGLKEEEDENVVRLQALHDLRVRPGSPNMTGGRGIFAETRQLNAIRAAMHDADLIVAVSKGQAQFLYDNRRNEAVTGKLGDEIEASAGKITGIANGLDAAGIQREFLETAFRDDEVIFRVPSFLKGQLKTGPDEYPGFLSGLTAIGANPRSPLDIGDEKRRRMLAKAVFDFVQPVQQKRLQNYLGLDTDRNAFILSMLHRIDVQKGHQLLISDVWDAGQPDSLRLFEGQKFENMHGQTVPLETGQQERLRAFASYHSLGRLTLADVLLVLYPELQLAVIGNTTDQSRHYDEEFHRIASRHPGRFYFLNHFIAHGSELHTLMESGAGLFLMPSYFEPAGLSQREVHAYGVPAYTTRRQGLIDTVLNVQGTRRKTDGGEETVTVSTGFDHFNPLDFFTGFVKLHEVANHKDLYRYRDPQTGWEWSLWEELKYRAMTQDNRWKHSADEYAGHFRRLQGKELMPWLPAVEVLTAVQAAGPVAPRDVLAEYGYNTQAQIDVALATAALFPDDRLAQKAAEFPALLSERRSELRPLRISAFDLAAMDLPEQGGAWEIPFAAAARTLGIGDVLWDSAVTESYHDYLMRAVKAAQAGKENWRNVRFGGFWQRFDLSSPVKIVRQYETLPDAGSAELQVLADFAARNARSELRIYIPSGTPRGRQDEFRSALQKEILTRRRESGRNLSNRVNLTVETGEGSSRDFRGLGNTRTLVYGDSRGFVTHAFSSVAPTDRSEILFVRAEEIRGGADPLKQAGALLAALDQLLDSKPLPGSILDAAGILAGRLAVFRQVRDLLTQSA